MRSYGNDSYKLLQLINTATTIKLINLPQQTNDRFDININDEW